MRAVRSVLGITTLWALAACSSAAPPAGAPPAERAGHAGKPSAAVTVTVADRDLGGGDHELTLTATPTRDVASFEMELDGQHVTVGATAAGEARTLTARVHLADGEGRDVVGTAWIGEGNHRRNRAALTHIGAVRVQAAKPTRIVTMPDGTVVEEAQP
jgi:hypothetical protein